MLEELDKFITTKDAAEIAGRYHQRQRRPLHLFSVAVLPSVAISGEEEWGIYQPSSRKMIFAIS